MCQHRSLFEKKKVTEEQQTKYKKIMKKTESEFTSTYLDEMQRIKKDLNLDELYWKKFGILKKSSVLASYGRYKDAKIQIAKAAEIIKEQMTHNQARMEAIQKRWKFKLGLDDGFELPETIDLNKTHPKYIQDSDFDNQDQAGVNIATMRLFIEKVSPFNIEGHDKNVFLDRCIIDLYKECEAVRVKRFDDI